MRGHRARPRHSFCLLTLLALVLPPQPLAAGQSPDAVEVKFAAGAAIRVREGRLASPAPGELAGILAALRAHPVRSSERLFSQPEAQIARERSALATHSGKELPDLNQWCRMQLAPGTDVVALVDALNALPEVEIAYPAPLPAPPPGAVPATVRALSPPARPEPPSPSYVALQGYLGAAPGGIAAGVAWSRPGGNGEYTTIVDVEYSFNASHEDLPAVPVIGGALYHGFGDDHGTAVLGELAGMNNAYGVRGVAAAARLKFSSPCADSSCNAYIPADAINAARLATTPGDVILIEQQTWACGTDDYGPLEWIPSVFDAITVAAAARRIVVEAAGNGNLNLDQSSCSGAFSRAVRDSGAIIVGAGTPPGYAQADRSRLYFSTYGSRVDLQGWGLSVTTAGYGNLYAGMGANQWYTDSFSGTSSASPIVAGAAALLSSIAQQRGMVLSPAKIRSLLASTGSPQQDAHGYPATERIGPRPDLRKALVALDRPALRSPVGSTHDPTPLYVWTKVPGATKYELAVFEGATRVVSRVFTGAVCTATTCSATGGKVLALAPHTWRVRAWLGAWKPWSAVAGFTVEP